MKMYLLQVYFFSTYNEKGEPLNIDLKEKEELIRPFKDYLEKSAGKYLQLSPINDISYLFNGTDKDFYEHKKKIIQLLEEASKTNNKLGLRFYCGEITVQDFYNGNIKNISSFIN